LAESGSQQIASWPAEHRAALSIVVHVGARLSESVSGDLDVGIDYTADGLHRLLALFEDLDVAVTTAWNGAALLTYPPLARNAQDRGHELALSVVDAGNEASDPDDLAGRISDLPIVGLVERLPQPGTSGLERRTVKPGTPSPRWKIDGSGGDVPRLHASTGSSGGTVILPVSPYWIDRHWWLPERPAAPSLLLESWSAGLASVRTFSGLMTIVLHPHLSGRPGHAETIVRFIDEAIASADVWLARADQVAAWWAESHRA
jgi:hypothetical protein